MKFLVLVSERSRVLYASRTKADYIFFSSLWRETLIPRAKEEKALLVASRGSAVPSATVVWLLDSGECAAPRKRRGIEGGKTHWRWLDPESQLGICQPTWLRTWRSLRKREHPQHLPGWHLYQFEWSEWMSSMIMANVIALISLLTNSW